MITFPTHVTSQATRIEYPQIHRRMFLGGILGVAGALALGATPLSATPLGTAPVASGPASVPGAPQILEPAFTVLNGYQGAVKGAVFSPDGTLLATYDDGETYAVTLSAADGSNRQSLAGHTGFVQTLAWTPDSMLLASGSLDDTTRLWAASGAPRATLEGQGLAAWSRNGAMLATNVSEQVKVYSPAGKLLSILPPKFENAVEVSCFAWSPDNTTLAVGTSANDVRLYRADGTLVTKLGGFTDFVQSVAWSPDGTTLAASSFDHTARLFRADGTTLATLHHGDSVGTIAWSPDGKMLVTSAETVYVWRADGGRITTLGDGTDTPVWSPDSAALAVASYNDVYLYRPGGTRIAVLTGHMSTVLVLAYAPDGKTLASGSRDSTVRLWHLT